MTWIFEYIVDKIVSSFNLMLSLTFDIYGFEVSLLSLQLALILCFVIVRFMTFGFKEGGYALGKSIKHRNAENAKDKQRQMKEVRNEKK